MCILNRNSLCRWNIVATGGTVKFEILFSDLVSGEECYSDTLEIFDGTVKMFCCLLSAHLNQSLALSRDKPAFFLYQGPNRQSTSLTQGPFCDSRRTFPSRNGLTFSTSGTTAFIRFRSLASGWRRHGFVVSFVEEAAGQLNLRGSTLCSYLSRLK